MTRQMIYSISFCSPFCSCPLCLELGLDLRRITTFLAYDVKCSGPCSAQSPEHGLCTIPSSSRVRDQPSRLHMSFKKDMLEITQAFSRTEWGAALWLREGPSYMRPFPQRFPGMGGFHAWNGAR